MTDRELLEQALEALEQLEYGVGHEEAIAALRARLAQPEQEPVAWIDEFGNVFPLGAQRGPKWLNEPMKPLYTTPPRREWQGLTMDDMADLAVSKEWLAGARWAEAKLREKTA